MAYDSRVGSVVPIPFLDKICADVSSLLVTWAPDVDTVPENTLLKNELNMDHSLSESEALKKLKLIAQKNQIYRNFDTQKHNFWSVWVTWKNHSGLRQIT